MDQVEIKTKKLNVKILIILVGVLIFSFTFILKINNSFVLAEGETHRFDVDRIEIDHKHDTIHVDLSVTNPEASVTLPENRHNRILIGNSDLYYKINKVKNSTTLSIARKKDINDDQYLFTNEVDTKSFPRTEYYIEGDELRELNSGMDPKLGYIILEADIRVKNGAYVVEEIYINKIKYEDYIKENYFELLEE